MMRTAYTGSLLLIAALSLEAMGGPAIGVAIARGYFQVDSSKIYGNGTIFDGSTVQAGNSAADVHLNSGARLRLGPDSQVTVYRDRFEALGLRITPVAKASTSIEVRDGKRLAIEALDGAAVVSNADGFPLATLRPGTALEFDTQAAGATASTTSIQGRLTQSGGQFFVTDETSRQKFQLVGRDLTKSVGAVVLVAGTIDARAKAAPGAVQVLRVESVKETGGAAATARPRMSGKTKAIIGGVAVGTASAGLAARKRHRDHEDDDNHQEKENESRP